MAQPTQPTPKHWELSGTLLNSELNSNEASLVWLARIRTDAGEEVSLAIVIPVEAEDEFNHWSDQYSPPLEDPDPPTTENTNPKEAS